MGEESSGIEIEEVTKKAEKAPQRTQPDLQLIEGGRGNTQKIIPETKKSSTQNFEVLFLPSVKNEIINQKDFLREDPRHIQRIAEYLNFLEKLVSREKAPSNFAWLISELKKVYITYKNRIQAFVESSVAGDLMQLDRSDIKRIGEKEEQEDDIKGKIKEDFEGNQGQKICLSDSHLLTYHTLRAAYETRDDSGDQIGVFVFDNHVDLLGDVNGPNWKGNIFAKLGMDTIKKATFIGGRRDTSDIDKMNRLLRQDVYNQIDIKTLKDNQRGVSRSKMKNLIFETIRAYKISGITNVVFSVDIDVLRVKQMGYTAMEYNPMHYLGYLTSLNLPIDKDPSQLTERETADIKSNLIDVTESHSGRYNPLPIILDEENVAYDPEGMSLGDVGNALDNIAEACQQEGLRLGVKLKGGGEYLGDVVELSGPDYGGRTTKATSALIDRIKFLATNKQPVMAKAA